MSRTKQPTPHSAPKIISLFSGAGGLDYGFEAAGFETAVAIEFNHDCCETLRHNRRWEVIERDILDVPTEELLERAFLKKEQVDLLIGGPPCQPFSKSGYWSKGDSLRLEDPRANTLSAYLRIVEEARPRVFVLENVEGLAYSGKDEGLQLLLSRIQDINKKTGSKYAPAFAVINAADYGVPQLRARFFLVAARDGTTFRLPAPTHGSDEEIHGSLPGIGPQPYRTAWDAIGDIRVNPSEDLEIRGKWADLIPTIPEGQNYLWHTKRGGGTPLFGWRRRYWGFLLKLAKDRPSWTIQAQPGPAIGPFHWDNRRLSMRELCRIQTFPDDVEIVGGRTSIQRQLGNAVPSLLAEVIGRSVRTQLLGLPAFNVPPRLLPPRRIPVPPAAPFTQDIPAKFRDLIGDHPDHPGTGKGNGARLRAAVDA